MADFRDLQQPFRIEIEYSGNNPVYVGMAVPNTATSAPAWAIMKLIYSGNNVVQVLWADGTNQFKKIWDSRAGYSYS